MRKSLKWFIAQKTELRWWRNYLKGKDFQKYHESKVSYWNRVLKSIQDYSALNSGLDILDAGCGPAGIFIAIADCSMDAIDPLLDQYKRNLPYFEPQKYKNVSFHCCPIEEYVTSKKYDIIFATNSINHVKNINQSYAMLAGYLKPGGRMIVTVDAHNHPLIKYLFRLIPGDILHPHQYDMTEYSTFLTQNDLTIIYQGTLKKSLIFNYNIQVATKR